jgi:PqqD family protein of HPr-rel-A system
MSKLLVANPEIVFRLEEDEGILFDPKTGEIKLLNETGAFIYQLLDGKHSKEEILNRLMEEYDCADRTKAEKDLDTFLQEMRRSQLVGELE